MFVRPYYQQLKERIEEPKKFIQIVMGPRQVGKTTLVKQVLEHTKMPFLLFSADDVPTSQRSWISDCWQAARTKMAAHDLTEMLLVIDEIQKIQSWSETVKKEWDADIRNDVNIKVLLTGSSRVLLERGLADSLAGRFEILRIPMICDIPCVPIFLTSTQSPSRTKLHTKKHRRNEYQTNMKTCKLYYILLLILLCVSAKYSIAQDNTFNNHVIVAFDDALPPQYVQLLRSGTQVQNAISQLSKSHNLLNDTDDYYSYINFAVGQDIPMFKHFATPSISRQGKCIKWIPYNGYYRMYSDHGNWDDIAFFQGAKRAQKQGYGPYSLLTGAKQFSLVAAQSTKNEEVANHTYLILVTDDWYAGMDNYRKEFDQVFANRAPKIEPFFRYYYDYINSTYRFIEIDTRPIMDDYKAILYEVIPNASFSLNSVLDYPATCGLKRVRGGYRIELDPCVYDTLYCVSRIEVKIKGKKDTTYTFVSEDGLQIHSDIIRTHKLPSDSIEVTLSGWVQVKDKFYGGMEMSPYDQKYSRLQSVVKIPTKKQARVFGLPLLDCFWWWYPNNAELAALVWQFVIIFIVIIMVVISIRKFLQKKTIYEPTDKELKIERID